VFLRQCPAPKHQVVQPGDGQRQRLFVKKPTMQIRPFCVAAVLRNISLTKEIYDSFIDLQVKGNKICKFWNVHFGRVVNLLSCSKLQQELYATEVWSGWPRCFPIVVVKSVMCILALVLKTLCCCNLVDDDRFLNLDMCIAWLALHKSSENTFISFLTENLHLLNYAET